MPESRKIQVSEIFGPVFQGEGALIGAPTIFVRTFGCDSRCRQCDSLYAVLPDHPGADSRRGLTPEEISKEVMKLDPTGRIAVTLSGGNPAIWDLYTLVKELHAEGRNVWLETQGTHWNTWLWMCDHVTVSPKGPGMQDDQLGITSMDRLEPFYRMGATYNNMCWKIVIFNRDDIDYAEKVAAYYPGIPLYLSVGNSMVEEELNPQEGLLWRLKNIQKEVLKHPNLYGARILPQLHVLTHGNQRGV